MITLKRVVESGTCIFCNKGKEVVAVVMDGQGAGEVLLCWADLRKMAQMRMRVATDGKSAAATPPSAGGAK